MTIEHTDGGERLARSLMDLAVAGWRFSRLFARLLGRLEAGEGNRYANQLRYFQRQVEECLEDSGMRLVNVEGTPFDPGMAASAVNIADFGPDEALIVDQMLEPIIVGPEGLRRPGTVTLRRLPT